jgi:NADH-quinone oxidoreductase subunit E
MSQEFKFSSDNEIKIKDILKKYPDDHPQSAVMPLLDLAQVQNDGWLSQSAIEAVAEILKMPVIRVQEVATFYSMYHLKPVGKTVVQVCTTTPCWLRGSNDVMTLCKNKLNMSVGETKNDITLLEVQCLGACVNAPIVQLNDTYLENVTLDLMDDTLNQIRFNNRGRS